MMGGCFHLESLPWKRSANYIAKISINYYDYITSLTYQNILEVSNERKTKADGPFATFCLLAHATALAGGAPSSQFGFKGWPYRQNNSCTAICPSATPPVTPAPTEVPTPEPTVTPSETEVPPFTDEDYTTGSITAQEENAFLLLNQDRPPTAVQRLSSIPRCATWHGSRAAICT